MKITMLKIPVLLLLTLLLIPLWGLFASPYPYNVDFNSVDDQHARATYRNFFYPHQRWMFSGIRLADDR